MEIADIFVVNKSDLPGANKKVSEIETMLDLDQREKEWSPPVILTNARSGEGIPELVDKIGEHIEFLKKSGLMERKDLKRSQEELEDLMKYRLTRKLLDRLRDEPEYAEVVLLVFGERREHAEADENQRIARVLHVFLAERLPEEAARVYPQISIQRNKAFPFVGHEDNYWDK